MEQEYKSATRALEEVTRAMSRYGQYRADEAIESMSPLTVETLRIIGGYKAFCQSRNMVRACLLFRETYNDLLREKTA